MTKKEVVNLTYETLNRCLGAYGYRYIKSEMYFNLKIGYNTYSIGYHCVDRKPEYKISLVFEIRNDQVEDIANRFSLSNPDYFKYSATVIVPFMYFVQKRLDFIVSNEADFDSMYDSVSSLYQHTIKPFIESHASLQEISMFVDNAIQESNPFFPITINLYRRNIILLKLTNNIEFENKANQIRTEIESFPENEKQVFENTYQYLKTLKL